MGFLKAFSDFLGDFLMEMYCTTVSFARNRMAILEALLTDSREVTFSREDLHHPARVHLCAGDMDALSESYTTFDQRIAFSSKEKRRWGCAAAAETLH